MNSTFFAFKKAVMRPETLVFLLSCILGTIALYSSLVNPYVFQHDARVHLCWMNKFYDKTLFQDDLIAKFSEISLPWGYVAFYRLLSPLIHPYTVSKFLPIILFATSCLYLFKLVRHLTASNFAGFLSSLIFMTAPVFIMGMIGGFSRSFTYPFLIVSLYYLVTNKYLTAAILLAVQPLFHPIAYFLTAFTFFFYLILSYRKSGYFSRKFLIPFSQFAVGAFIGISILLAHQHFSYDPAIGHMRSGAPILEDPACQNSGRFNCMPPPFVSSLVKYFREVVFAYSFLPDQLYSGNKGLVEKAKRIAPIFLIVGLSLFLLNEFRKKKFSLPIIIISLFLSSVVMRQLAILFFFRLYFPDRYFLHAIPLVSLLLVTVVLAHVLSSIKSIFIKRSIQSVLIITLFLNIGLIKNLFLTDYSPHKDLYEFIKTLPKNSMIAAYPKLADSIPLLASRKVFIGAEQAVPFFDKYWETMSERIYNFFDAYYASDLGSIYDFMEKNHIDYLVVDKNHFSPRFLKGKVFFEPFNTYIKKILNQRTYFVLEHIPDKDKIYSNTLRHASHTVDQFEYDDIFVVPKDVFDPRKNKIA